MENKLCVERNDLKPEEVKEKLEEDYDEVCIDYDVEEPKLIVKAYDMAPCTRCDDKTIEIRYHDYEQVLEMLTELIRIYNIEQIKSKISRYQSRVEKIKERIKYAKKHNDQFVAKYEEMIKGLELKVKGLQEQIQNPEKIEPELLLGEVAGDSDDFEEFLNAINAPQNVKQLLEYYAFGKFIADEEKLPLDTCDDFETDDEEVDIADPYWCVKDEFEIEGYLVFLPAKKSLKIIMSVISDEYKELNKDVTLYTIKFNDAYSLLKTIDDYYKTILS
jgi:hypothetical protein